MFMDIIYEYFLLQYEPRLPHYSRHLDQNIIYP